MTGLVVTAIGIAIAAGVEFGFPSNFVVVVGVVAAAAFDIGLMSALKRRGGVV